MSFTLTEQTRMKYSLVILFSLWILTCNGQTGLGRTVTEKLEPYQFYFIGQAHNNKANTLLEKELLLALNKKWGVRYDILEYSHSAAFLINEYLQTGEDSLLAVINSGAPFNFIRAVKTHNDTCHSARKIRFYGLDFENRQDGKYTRKAIGRILGQTMMPVKETLYSLLSQVAGSAPKELNEKLKTIKYYLDENEEKCRLLLDHYFLDLSLIVNAQFDFSPKRDDAMFANFIRLHRELTGRGENPSFLASFGTGHINPGNKKGLAMKLMQEDNSPVKNKVGIIGVQYVNCQFNAKGQAKSTYGNLDFLCKSRVPGNFSAEQAGEKEEITFLPRTELLKLNCNNSIGHLAGLLVVSNFGATKYGCWE